MHTGIWDVFRPTFGVRHQLAVGWEEPAHVPVLSNFLLQGLCVMTEVASFFNFIVTVDIARNMRINSVKIKTFEFIDSGYVDEDSKCFAVLVQGLRFDVIEAKPGEEEAFDARLRSILRYGNLQRAHVLQGLSLSLSSDADIESWANAIDPTLKLGGSKASAVVRGEYDIVILIDTTYHE